MLILEYSITFVMDPYSALPTVNLLSRKLDCIINVLIRPETFANSAILLLLFLSIAIRAKLEVF
jgi:hypothetical protein